MSIVQYDGIFRRGLGLGAPFIGTRFKVYRLGGASGIPNAAASIIDPLNLVYSAFPIRMTLGIPKCMQEQELLYKQYYSGTLCDASYLKPGDILVETGPQLIDTPDGRVFIFIDVQPLLPAVFARAEVYSQITRTHDSSATDQPLQGGLAIQGETKFTEWLLTLNDGMYDMVSSGVSAVIPIGLQPRQRPGSALDFKNPTATHRGAYVGYAPLLPGFKIEAGDYFTDANGGRYRAEIVNIFETGLQGYQMILESVLV